MISNKEPSAYNTEYFQKLLSATTINNIDADALSSELFYSKLLELKNEQKRKLLLMQDLYENKNNKQKEEEELVDDYKFKLNAISAYSTNVVDNNLEVCDLCSSPLNDVVVEKKPPPIPNRTKSKLIDDVDEELSRIEKLWNDYKLSETKSVHFDECGEEPSLPPPPPLRRSSSYTSIRRRPMSASGDFSGSEEWAPKITIPKPFNMTLRDERRAQFKKLKLQAAKQALEIERDKCIDGELKECRRKFKAQPVPAYVTVPLYEQRKLAEQVRKQKLKEASKVYLNTVPKPFNLSDNNKEATIRERRHSYSAGDDQQQTDSVDDSSSQLVEFRAQPLPDFYFEDGVITQKMKKDEMYRRIKSQIRALELLKQSRLPHNMELQEEKKILEAERNRKFIQEMNRLQQEMNERESKSRHNHKYFHDVPDHDAQYKRFVVEMETRKSYNRKNTKSKPFDFVSAQRSRDCQNDPYYNDSLRKNQCSSSMSRLNKSMSTSMDSLPIKGTEAQRLRESLNKSKLECMVKKELQQEHIDKFRKIRMKKIHEKMQDKVKQGKHELDKNIDRQTRQLRLEQRKNEENYEEKLTDMEKKLENRPLLIHQIDEENIRRAVEKKYEAVLRKAGLNENALHESSSWKGKVAKSAKNNIVNDDWILE